MPARYFHIVLPDPDSVLLDAGSKLDLTPAKVREIHSSWQTFRLGEEQFARKITEAYANAVTAAISVCVKDTLSDHPDAKGSAQSSWKA